MCRLTKFTIYFPARLSVLPEMYFADLYFGFFPLVHPPFLMRPFVYVFVGYLLDSADQAISPSRVILNFLSRE